MVLSLVELSIHSIINGMINGTIQHPHLLSPIVRTRVLDTAIKQDLTNHPNCLELFTTVEFLNGLTSISANACNDNDLEFLERLVASLATKLSNGQTVGAGIKQLNLKVYDVGVPQSNFKSVNTYSNVISKLSDLIGHCPNSTSMALQLRKSQNLRGYWPLNENENSACNQVMESLINLSVVMSNGERIINTGRPIIKFKKLTTLKLKDCSFDDGSCWPKLMEKIPLLENLHFFNVFITNGLESILPFPLAHLKSLKVIGRLNVFKCNKAFVDKLMECPELRQVQLILDQASTDEESLVRLANMDIDLKIKARLDIYGNDAVKNAAIFDSASRFKVVQIFHGRMDSFELNVWPEWNEQCSIALEDVVNTCSNLTSFGIKQPRFLVNQAQVECSEEKKRFIVALVQFFSTRERAQQLEGLRLIGNIDESVLSSVFDNCQNLVRLVILECPTLRDQHLIDWVARGGGKLTDLVLVKCNNVTSEGIIPIFSKSDGGLLRYLIDVGQDKNGRDWKKVLRNHCPNAVIDNYLSLIDQPSGWCGNEND